MWRAVQQEIMPSQVVNPIEEDIAQEIEEDINEDIEEEF